MHYISFTDRLHWTNSTLRWDKEWSYPFSAHDAELHEDRHPMKHGHYAELLQICSMFALNTGLIVLLLLQMCYKRRSDGDYYRMCAFFSDHLYFDVMLYPYSGYHWPDKVHHSFNLCRMLLDSIHMFCVLCRILIDNFAISLHFAQFFTTSSTLPCILGKWDLVFHIWMVSYKNFNPCSSLLF